MDLTLGTRVLPAFHKTTAIDIERKVPCPECDKDVLKLRDTWGTDLIASQQNMISRLQRSTFKEYG